MKIGLDITRANISDGGGRYVRELTFHLCRSFPEHKFYCLGPKCNRLLDFENVTHIYYPEVDGLLSRLRYTYQVTSLIRQYNLDVFHNLCNYGILNPPCHTVTTIFDLISLKYPNLRTRGKVDRFLYKYICSYLARRARHIITISQSSKLDLRKYYGIIDKITITPLGFNSSNFHTNSENDSFILEKHKLKPGFLFFVGTITPKKNVETILLALKLLREEGIVVPLVIAGKQNEEYHKLIMLACNLEIDSQLNCVGPISDEDLAALYRQASILVFPSLYEGFGLPLIEAMACGTPPLVSNISSLPEIVTRTELLCSPSNPTEWAHKSKELLASKRLYEEMRSYGIQRAKEFSWEKCVKQTMGVYNNVCNSTFYEKRII